jgi:hypothetical protein
MTGALERVDERRKVWRDCDKLELVIGLALATILTVAAHGHMLPSGALALVGVGCLAGALLLVRRWRATEVVLRKELQRAEEHERRLHEIIGLLELRTRAQDRLISDGHKRMERMLGNLKAMQEEYWSLVLRDAEREFARANAEILEESSAGTRVLEERRTLGPE